MSKKLPVMDHPRIFFLKSDLKGIRRTGFEAKGFLNEKEMKLTYMGGKEITFPLPPVEPGKIEEPPGFDHKAFGHYPYWTAMAGNIRGRMEHLALSFASTANPSYADAAISYALSLADWNVWTDLQYHPDGSTCLDTCSLAFGASTVYDMCYERMTPEQRAKVRRGLIGLGLEPLYRDCVKAFTDDRTWMRAWNLPLYQHSALGIGALTLMGDVPEGDFSRWLGQAKEYFTWFLEQQMISPDTEGMGYDSFSVDYAMIFADAFKRVTGNDELFRHLYVTDFLPKRAIYFYGPNDSGCVNFGDCGRENGGGRPFVTTMKIIAKHTGNGYAGWYLEATRPRIMPVSRNELDLYAVPKPPVTSPSSLPTSKVFQNIGWVALRSGWEGDATLFAFKCSSSQAGHDHWDQNNFVINCAGEWLATDAGYGSFKSAEDNLYGKNTVGHNTVLIDGEGQKQRAGHIAAFYTAPGYDYTVGDASKCYDSGKLIKFLRHVVYVKPEYFLILDELQSEGSPRQFEWLLHTDMEGIWSTDDGKKITVGETLKAANLWIEKTRAKLATQILLPKEPKVVCDQHRKLEVYGPFIRVSAQRKEPQMRFLTMLCPMARNGKGEKEPPKADLIDKIENGAVGVKVSREVLKDMVMFNLGGGVRSVEGIKSDAENCLITMDEEKVVGYALHNGTSLALDEKLLILSSNPLSASVHHMNNGLTANILLGTPAKIGIASTKSQRVTVDNLDLAPQNFAFDTKRQILTLWLREGEHTITVKKTP